MKPKTILTLLLVAMSIAAQGQEKNDYTPFVKVEVGDIKEALRYLDVHIYKHDIGTFNEKPNISIIVEEWKDFKLVDSKVRMSLPLESTLWENDDMEKQPTNIVRATSVAKNDSLLIVEIAINDIMQPFYLRLKEKAAEGKHLPYFPVPYKNKLVEMNKNIPIMLYGTMWHDKEYNVYRFCGRDYLTNEENDEDTKEFLTSSPHFYIISYRIEKPKE